MISFVYPDELDYNIFIFKRKESPMKSRNRFKFLIMVTTAAIAILHLINHFVSYLATLKGILNTNQGNFYEWRFGRIFYTKQGNGSPILLIHDLNSSASSYEWNRIIKSLSETNTVYALDLLGCGRSDKPNLTYTNFLYVQMISDFVKNVIQHKTDVIVTGASNSFVIMACHNDETIFNKILMINPDSLFKLNQVPSKKAKSLKLIFDVPVIGTFIYNIWTCKVNIRCAFENRFFSNEKMVSNKTVNAYFESAHNDKNHSKYLYASILGKYTNINILHALKELNNSIFAIGGSDEKDINNTIDNYIYYNPSIESAYIEDTKHLPQLEAPEEIIEQIQIFFHS